MDSLEKSITTISPLSPEVMQIFRAAWKQWNVPKDHFLLKEQGIANYIYFIENGIARIYYFKIDKEITEWIATDHQFFLSITSFFQRTPSHLIIHTLEPALVFGIHHDDLMALARQYHEIERLFRKMLTLSLILSQQRMNSIQFETALQRYEKLILSSPGIIQRVPLTYIASFLGITLETLSRIRSKK